MNQNKTYELQQFMEFIRILYCISYDRFLKLYKRLFGEHCDGYAKEKFELLSKYGPARFMCELDYETLEQMIQILLIEKSI